MVWFALWYLTGLVAVGVVLWWAYQERDKVTVGDLLLFAAFSLLGPVLLAYVIAYWALEINKGWTKRIVIDWRTQP